MLSTSRNRILQTCGLKQTSKQTPTAFTQNPDKCPWSLVWVNFNKPRYFETPNLVVIHHYPHIQRDIRIVQPLPSHRIRQFKSSAVVLRHSIISLITHLGTSSDNGEYLSQEPTLIRRGPTSQSGQWLKPQLLQKMDNFLTTKQGSLVQSKSPKMAQEINRRQIQ